MHFSEYLSEEWVPTLGCTEPASIALAAATAAGGLSGPISQIDLTVDPRMYKNCYAVGTPHSGRKTGILWAAAVGAYLPDVSKGLRCFSQVTDDMVAQASELITNGKVRVQVDTTKETLFIDCRVRAKDGRGHAVVVGEHTNVVLVEKDEVVKEKRKTGQKAGRSIRKTVAGMELDEMLDMSRSISTDDRNQLRYGIEINRHISEYGLSLFPKEFVKLTTEDQATRASALVCGGVYARMWGEELPVMSLAGSGNKGIVTSVPLAIRGEMAGYNVERVDEALALACLVTSATTCHLGTLSAVCGCSNAAGIGLAAGLVLLEGGGKKEIELAIHNMVGNVTGMICDGAKIGCALKTMTSVDAALRASSLAMNGVGIPPSDGIVGTTGAASLVNLGRIASRGMVSMDAEILSIMEEKMSSAPPLA